VSVPFALATNSPDLINLCYVFRRRWIFCRLTSVNRADSVVNKHLDLNLPICGLIACLVLLFLRLRKPPVTLREMLGKIDFMSVH
jgi:hypothetical protein